MCSNRQSELECILKTNEKDNHMQKRQTYCIRLIFASTICWYCAALCW